MNILEATEKYEKWLSGHIELDHAALEKKHSEMTRDPFRFFRATFYHWAHVWPDECKDLSKAPQVLAVGDLHVENFGTWRDEEGRLVWGINDFDEASDMPYTNDLVRLATSAKLAIDLEYLQITFPQACKEILQGYRSTIKKYLDEGKEQVHPIVLAERNEWLSQLAIQQVGDPDDFWNKFQDPNKVKPVHHEHVPTPVRAALVDLLPGDSQELAFLSWNKRDAGLGSLGRRRFVALAEWRGGKVAREAKELCPSAWQWANAANADNGKKSKKTKAKAGTTKDDIGAIRYEDVLNQAVRCLDPCVRLVRCPGSNGKEEDCWFVRRLSADCIKVELESVPDQKEDDLFQAMGRETANIHIASGAKALKKVQRHLEEQNKNWLKKAATQMAKVTVAEWEVWCDREQKRR